MTNGLNLSFSRWPYRFFANNLVRIPMSALNFRIGGGEGYTFRRAPNVRALDLSAENAREIPVVDLTLYDARDGYINGDPNGASHSLNAFWAPYNPPQLPAVNLSRDHRFFFTAELSGCSLAVSHGINNVVYHIPPERRLRLLNTIIPTDHPSLNFSYFTPEFHYDCENNKRTIFYGLRSAFRRRWRFFSQTTLHTQHSSPEYRSFYDAGYEYVRLSNNVEFSVPFT